MDLVEALARQRTVESYPAPYSDEQIAYLESMMRAGGDNAAWAKLELQRVGRYSPEVLGTTS